MKCGVMKCIIYCRGLNLLYLKLPIRRSRLSVCFVCSFAFFVTLFIFGVSLILSTINFLNEKCNSKEKGLIGAENCSTL